LVEPVMTLVPSAHNCLIITGRVAAPCEMRTSPAGVPIGRFLLEHHSRQVEAGFSREVRCRIPVIVCGEPLARTAGQLLPGMQVRVQGFVSRDNPREGEYRLVLHAAHIDVLNAESSED